MKKREILKIKREKLFSLLISMWVAVALVALTLTWAPRAQAKMPVKELKVGFVAPLSGPAAPWGLPKLRTIQIEVDKINAAGGIVCKDTRYKIKLIVEDNKYKGAAGVAAVNKLVYEDKVKYIIGDIAGGIIGAEQEITNPNKVLWITDGWGKELLSPEKDYCFRSCLTSGEVGSAIFKYFREKYPEASKMAIVNPDDPRGWSGTKYAVNAWKSMNLPVVLKEYYVRGTTDFAPLVTRLLAAKPNLIATSGCTLGVLGLIMKECREKGYTGNFAYNGNCGEAEKLSEIVGDVSYIEGLVSVSVDYTSPKANSLVKEHAKEYMARYGEWGETGIIAGGWVEVHLLKQIIEETQSLNPTVLRDHMEKPCFTFDTPWGGKGWFGGKSEYGIAHQACYPFWVTEIQNGRFVNMALFEVPKDY